MEAPGEVKAAATACASAPSSQALVGPGEGDPEAAAGPGRAEGALGGGARLGTTALLALAFTLGRADWLMLGAVFTPLGRDLQASPSQLGTITLCRALTQALLSPLSGALGDHANRIPLIAAGQALWGACAAAFAASRTLGQAIAAAACTGVGLALVQPCAQSLTADLYSAGARGKAFGTLYTLQALGGLAGGFFATSVSSKAPLGIAGWRFAFYVVGILAGLAGLLTLLGRDVRHARPSRWRQGRGAEGRRWKLNVQLHRCTAAVAAYGRTLQRVWRVRSFQVLVLQGIFGGMPWLALSFVTAWLQLQGFRDVPAATLTALMWAGTAAGNILGGVVGDALCRWLGPRGRPLTCQLSVFAGLPLTLLLFRLPQGTGAAGSADPLLPKYAAALALFGLLVSWPATNNSAVFSEVVLAGLRSSVYAFDGCVEGAVSAAAAPLVGVLAERCFGYRVEAQGSSDAAWRLANARALGQGLQVCLMVPWALELLAYTLLYFTFPRDRARVLEAQAPDASQ